MNDDEGALIQEIEDLEKVISDIEQDLADAEMFLEEWYKAFEKTNKKAPETSLIARTKRWLDSRAEIKREG